MLLAILGFFFIKQQMQLGQREKKDLLLCGYLAIALSLFAAVARPTFERYYVISMPFLTVLAAFGIYSIGTRIMNSRQPALLVLIILALFGSGAVIFMYNYFHSSPFGWREIEKAAEEVNRTTPPNALLWSPEAIYATAHRIPPPGLENWFATKLELPPGQADLLHIRQEGEMKELLRSGRVGTLVMWSFNPAPNASDKLEGLQFFDGHEKYGNLEIWFHRSQGNR